MKFEKYRNNFDYSYTLGITLTIELLLKHPHDVLTVYYSSDFSGEGKDKVDELTKKYHIETIVSDKFFNIVASKENVYCIGVFKKFNTVINNENNHIVLVNPSNAGNLGTILRTACGFGMKDIAIIKPCVDIFDPKTVRASMGAIFNINFKLYDNFSNYEQEHKRNYYPFMLKAKTKLNETNFVKPFSLIFGNEATGLPDNFLQYDSVIIAHSHEIDSLNLPIACSIAIYEATKGNY